MNKGSKSLLTILIVILLFIFLLSIFKRDNIIPIRVVILNASGDKSVNKFISNYLKTKNVDVIYIAELERENIKSVVVDRYSNKCKYAKKIANYLTIKSYIPIIDTAFTEQVIVILGNDLDKIKLLKRRRI